MSAQEVTAVAAPKKRRAGFPTKSKLFGRNEEDIRNFHAKPDDAWSSLEVIAYLENCSVQTLWRRSKNGKGPRIVIIGGQARVSVGEYRRLNAARIAAAAQPEPLAA